MLSKMERTTEVYMRVGAKMRLYKTLGAALTAEIGKILSKKDLESLFQAMKRIDEVCSRADDNMFRDHPEITDEYRDVFYGSTNREPVGSLDRRMISMAREAADALFKGKRY